MKFAADENFDGTILRGLLKRLPDLDIVRVQDTAMYHAPDPPLLEWLAEQDRILVTHDIQTMPGFVYARVAAGLPVPGVLFVPQDLPIGIAIAELLVAMQAGDADDFANQFCYIPLD